MVSKKDKEEDKIITKIQGPWQTIAYLIKFRTKEIMGVIILLLAAWILIANITCDEKGLQWRPSIEYKKNKLLI